MVCRQVTAGLYIGDLGALAEVEALGITHVLTVLNYDPEQPVVVEHLRLDVEDSESANLLDHLEEAVEFIEEAIDDDGKVLVHCQQGVSRSAAVVVAYLCYSMGLSVEQALETLRHDRPQAQPNDGFMQQLRLFKVMGCEVDDEHEGYRNFKLAQKAQRWEEQGRHIDEEDLAEVAQEYDEEAIAKMTLYRCKKCRRMLATSQHTVGVGAGPGQGAFPFRKRDGGPLAGSAASSAPAEEGCVFVEPLRWMQGLSDVSGKLYCPGCGAKVGHFNWAGARAPTGVWVTPAFLLHLSKVDASKPLPAPAGLPAAPPAPLAGPAGAPAPAEAPTCKAAWFTHLVFDCDGVLVDSERASCEALRRAVLEVTGFDIPHVFPEDYNAVFGMDVPSCVAHYAATFGHSWDVAQVSEQVGSVKERHYQELTLQGIAEFPGVRALHAEAVALGVRVGIGSSGSPEKIRHNLQCAGLWDLFDPDTIVSAKTVGKGKPAPDVYLEALRRIGCTDASRSLVIEDSVHGLLAAKAAGAFAVGVTNTLSRASLQGVADLVVDSVLELDLGAMTRVP